MPDTDTAIVAQDSAPQTASPENADTGAKQSEDVFTFRRMSGLDQAILQTDWEWRNLASLDQKLWMAMSCPTHGLEFDSKTLELLDPDKDGRIRSADILAAVAWVCDRVRHPALLRESGEAMPLDNLRDDTEPGQELLAAARLTLEKSGAADAVVVTPAQIEAVLAEAEGYAFNGDGIVPVSSVPEDAKDLAEYVRVALAVVGAKKDASGKPGLDQDLAAEFAKRLEATRDFRARVAGASLPLGEATAAAWTLLTRLGPKIDDYFNRCRMADFAPGTLAALNEETALANAGLGPDGISADHVGELIKENLAATLVRMPLARVAARQPLPLDQGLNPAWLGDVKEFRGLLAPLLPEGALTASLGEEAWAKIKQDFASYAGALESKPVYDLPPADATRLEVPGLAPLALAPAPAGDALGRVWMPVAPNEDLDKLDDAQIARLLDPALQKAFADLAQKDLAAPKMAAIQDLDKLALFHAHLYTLLMNFVSFIDFYEPEKRAIFQAGTLYLDSRECRLCVPVGDLETHVRLAAQSHLCLIYCEIRRTEQDGAEATGSISAALTAGDLASLIDGRHGLFIDNHGREWDSVITKVVHNPISLREAVWAPYIRISNLISEQVHKFLAAKEESVSKASAEAVATAAAKPAEAKPSFDFAKGAGIFAAVSVALSVLSAAFAYIANSLASLGWLWPLALVGVFLCISGPSVLIAWFKLRRRSLGPLLDASGWAVNQGAPINLVMGQTLTSVGKMPPHARRNMDDPYRLTARMRKTRNRIRFWFWFLFLLALAAGSFALYCHWFGLPAWLTALLAHKPA